MDSDNILTFCPLFRSRNRTILPNNSKLLPNCIFTTKKTWKILMLLPRIQRAEHDPSLVKDEHRPTLGRILSGAVQKERVFFHYISLLQSIRKYTSYISCNVYFIDQENFCLLICEHIFCQSVHFIQIYPVLISQLSIVVENIFTYIFLVTWWGRVY